MSFLLVAVISPAMTPVWGEGLNYDFVSADYTWSSIKIDTVDETLDGRGYFVDLSYAVRPHIALMAGYKASNAESGAAGNNIDADVEAYLLGFMIHAAINETSDFIVGAGFINGIARVREDGMPERNVDADGGTTIIGFRTLALDSLEINGFIRKNSIEDNSTISLNIGLGYHVIPSLSFDLGYLIDSENGSDVLSLGVTKYF